jgi:hypothetical protein
MQYLPCYGIVSACVLCVAERKEERWRAECQYTGVRICSVHPQCIRVIFYEEESDASITKTHLGTLMKIKYRKGK